MQIGTPNAGSPLANVVQAGTVLLGGPLGSAIINALAGPAGVQLTTSYMETYNLYHGSNPTVSYTALGGDYFPPCLICPLSAALLLITGIPGDTIVPLSSVHALSYTQKRTFSSGDFDKDATHTKLEKSKPVFDMLSDRVKALGTNAPSGLPSQPMGPVQTTASAVGVIQQGQVVDLPLPIDEQVQVFIQLLYPSGDLSLVLISPSGLLIDPAFADADPDMFFDEGDILGGRMAVYSLGLPEVGVWTARVSANSVIDPSGEVGFSIGGWLESPSITFSGELTESAVPSGTPLTLVGKVLESGAPLVGATVAATVALPDDSQEGVPLLDDGAAPDAIARDGIYTGVFGSTNQSGNYRVVFQASRTSSPAGPDFSREDFALARVRSSSSTFSGTFADFGVDTDGDSLFNELVVEVDLNITSAADYLVLGELEDAVGNVLQANASASLTPGPSTVALSFDGEALFQNGVDGPYSLRVVRMAEEDGLALLPVDELSNAYMTAAYGYLEFQHVPIVLTGNGTSAGRDTDGNGLFDFLDVTIEVQTDDDDFYNWSARLIDDDGTELGFAALSGFFAAGVNSFSLSFEGEAIGANAVDGPYFVADMLAFGSSNSLVAAQVLTTQPFLASQFEGFVADVSPPTLDVVLAPSLLWPPKHQLVEVDALITVFDDIDPTPEVTLVSIESNEPDTGTGKGDKPNDIQEADFGEDDRDFLLRAERRGRGEGRVYTVTYRAVDDTGNMTEVTTTVVVPHDLGGGSQ